MEGRSFDFVPVLCGGRKKVDFARDDKEGDCRVGLGRTRNDVFLIGPSTALGMTQSGGVDW